GAVIIKHDNPGGVGVGTNGQGAVDQALATDPQSAYGGIYCFNRPIDASLAEKLGFIFGELVFAPGYEPDALEILTRKPNVRILENQERRLEPVGDRDIRRVRGGLLVQDRNEDIETRDEMRVVTERKPPEAEW